jgi:hypothetical protein
MRLEISARNAVTAGDKTRIKVQHRAKISPD